MGMKSIKQCSFQQFNLMKSRAQIIAFDKYAFFSNADLQIRPEYYQS